MITLVKMGENKYIDLLLQKTIELGKKGDKDKLELLLSKYRNLSQKTKDIIMGRINRMSMETVLAFYISFANSRYIFNNELAALKVE